MADNEEVSQDECACDYGCGCEDTVVLPEEKSAAFTWQAAGEKIEYTASANHLAVFDAEQVLEGTMFNLTYVATSVNGNVCDRKRPVTFSYNGGPGSASVPINFGGIGPRRVKTDGLNFVGADYEVEDNPSTLLRESDLVFLDALGTGWSRVAPGYDTKRVYGLEEDAHAFCRAICAWLEKNDRWGSPVYLLSLIHI